MSDMITRVAEAIHEADIPEAVRRYPELDVQEIRAMAEDLRGDHLAMARAAIEAMREPTREMYFAVAADWGNRTWRQYRQVIDAVLAEAQKREG